MTLNDGFGRTVSEWLDEQAGRGMPSYLDEVLARTTRTRQRPAWSSLERWLPMDLSGNRLALNRPARLRSFALLAVLALLIAVLVAVAIGTQRPLPPPFGVARNGALVVSGGGDIFLSDPAGVTSALIYDAKFDFGPMFSRDGTKLLFLRSPDSADPSAGLLIAVANADGSGVREITPAVPGLDWADWSPDGGRIAFISRPKGDGTAGVINVVNVDGTGLTTLDVGRPAHQVSWMPPAGEEILFRGEPLSVGDPPAGIFAVRPDGTGLRPVLTRPAAGEDDYQSIAVSPDGTRVAYRESAMSRIFRIHVLDLGTGDDRVLPGPTTATAQTGAVFSPDGLMLAYLRVVDDEQVQLVVAPADGSGTGDVLGPRSPFGPDQPTITNYGFTPDGTAVLASYDAENLVRRLSIDGSESAIVARGDAAFATYQRLAP